MAGTVEILCTISKKMYKAIKAGKAVLQSGGVRDSMGRILELANPVGKAASSAALGPISLATSCVSMASSLTSNVQCAYIQKGVNEANVKLDSILESMSGITGSLQKVQALSWVTSAFSLANCGISVAGFYMTMKKLNEVDGELRAFMNQYNADRKNDTVEKFQELMGKLITDLVNIKNTHSNETYPDQYFFEIESGVSSHIDECYPFICKVIEELKQNRIDSKLACQVIFTLTTAVLETINEYNSMYYYVHKKQHDRFDDWMKIACTVLNDDFRMFMKRHINLDAEYADMLPREKTATIEVAFETISRQMQKIETCQKLKTEVSEQEFASIDDVLNGQLYLQIDNMIRDEKQLTLDELLMKQIRENDVPDEGLDEDLIAIRVL